MGLANIIRPSERRACGFHPTRQQTSPVNESMRVASAWRLFLGLWPPESVRAQLVAHACAWSGLEDARRTAPDRLHVTLHFLGSVPTERLPLLQRALAGPGAGFELVLDRPRLWPGGLAVLEARRIPAPLAELHARLGEVLQRLEMPPDPRPWRPHVTLARRAQGARPPVATTPIRWTADGRYLLVRSLPGGAGYQPVQVFG